RTPACEALLATVDHIRPISRGGPASWTNLVAACQGCHNRKADRTPAEDGTPLRLAPYDPSHPYRVGGHDEDLPQRPVHASPLDTAQRDEQRTPDHLHLSHV